MSQDSTLPQAGGPSKPRILVVEDEDAIRTQMKWALAQDYEVFVAEDRRGAVEIVRRERPAVITLDLGLPPRPREVEEGFDTLTDILKEDPSSKVIVVTGRGDKEHALAAVGQGAYDFFCKPVDIDELKIVLRRALHVYGLEREHRELERRASARGFDEILGTSPQMEEVFAAIRKVATADAPVLVVGESGTGKELVARAIHRKSHWSDGPFVPINCGAIPENLLESELFGHEKGAFTGAHIQRKGRIELAHRGTLFLDEIGELSTPLQVKLLRYLQDHKIERVGGREEITVEARIIAATNLDLTRAMREGRFREDLYYRVGVVIIRIPPLRERGEDIVLLARALLQRYCGESGRSITGFNPAAVDAIQAYTWPGNIRELENRIKRAVIMAEGRRITPEDLELASANQRHVGKRLREAREAVEKEIIRRALAKNLGNISRTAVELGVSRPTLYELISRYGIEMT
ncbi:MAG TPA: PEP-CTERM-box response regulator transcription factor [Candidatus Binatia bacterium]|nr:PEP-CTERM-box response regulator transcription factor [Candidatus Binatia bacterium]